MGRAEDMDKHMEDQLESNEDTKEFRREMQAAMNSILVNFNSEI